MKRSPQAKYLNAYTVYYGSYGSSFKCNFCDEFVFARKGEGRGKGAIARGKIIQHLKKCHKEELDNEA